MAELSAHANRSCRGDSVTLHVINVWGQPVPEAATVEFTTSKGSVQVVDNAAGDLDPTMGTVKVAMTQAASYEACITDGTANSNAVQWDPTYPICRSLASSSTKVDLGSAYMRRIPKVGFYFQDMQGSAAKGGTLTTVWTGNYTLNVYDGMPGWDAVVDGLIVLKLVSGPGRTRGARRRRHRASCSRVRRAAASWPRTTWTSRSC